MLLLVLYPIVGVQAQDEPPDGPVYIVQAGDSLWAIAQRFGVSMDDLAAENGITDPGQLSIGARLVIPGLTGLQGVLVTETLPLGENLDSLARYYQLPLEALVRLNHYTSPVEAYAGSQLVVPIAEDSEQTPGEGGRATLMTGQSLLEIAIRHEVSPWSLFSVNQLSGVWNVFPGESLYIPAGDGYEFGALPDAITAINLHTMPLVQGQTLALELVTSVGVELQGKFDDRELHFFQTPDGSWMALQGIHAMLEPGLYPLSLTGSLPDGTSIAFSQMLSVDTGDYPFDPPLVVDSETTDIQNNETENELWFEVIAPITPETYWEGVFEVPVPAVFSECFPSRFGHRRSYNESGYYYFHTGLDFCGQRGTEIYAPAPGRVVLVRDLTVRGNATVIDHGRGVYSAYAHQSEIFVAEGDWVETGQVIGLVGETGRVTGPHLHWEIIVGGVQVDPQQWLAQPFP